MATSLLQKTNCGNYKCFEYEARNNGRIVRGTAMQIAQQLGRSVSWVREKALSGRFSKDGWQVVGITTRPVKRRPAVVYVAFHPDDDPVIGTAPEIAQIIDISEYSIRQMAKYGYTSRKGWRARKATPEEIEADEVLEVT